jgi:tryptophanyl-tRNA synthetase
MRVVSGIQPTGSLPPRQLPRRDPQLGCDAGPLPANGQGVPVSSRRPPRDLDAARSGELKGATLEMAAALVACGIDPQRSSLFNQAQVPAHAELQWLLNGTARMAGSTG